jgi:hypothetical protein
MIRRKPEQVGDRAVRVKTAGNPDRKNDSGKSIVENWV